MNRVHTALAIIFVMLASCGRSHSPHVRSKLNGLSASEKGGNVALLFETNFEYAYPDLPILKNILADESARYGFDVHTRKDSRKNDVLDDIATKAAAVGPEGTLFIYLAGHGSPNGYLQTYDGNFINFKSVKAAIQKGRTAPFRRLVIFVFSCYAGNWITGSEPVSLMTANITSDLKSGVSAEEGLYREVIVMTSSTANEQSWGGGNGTEFAMSIGKAFKDLKTSADKPTNKQFLDKIVKGVGSSTPQYKSVPESLLSEPLMNSDEGVPIPNPQPLSYAVALDAPNADSSSLVKVATDVMVDSVALCMDTPEACVANPALTRTLIPSTLTISGRKVFQSDTALALKAGIMSLNFYGPNRTLLGSKQVVLSAK